jgi:PAS domain S-box-containing protein
VGGSGRGTCAGTLGLRRAAGTVLRTNAVLLLAGVTMGERPSPGAARHGASRSTSLGGVLAALPAIVWEADGRDYFMTFVSPRARDLLGYEPGAWVASTTFWEDHLHPDDRERAIGEFDEALRARSAGQVEYSFRHADGSYRRFRDAFSVVEDGDGSVRLTGLMLDITDEHAARQAQARAEAERDRLIEAVEQSAESISIADAEGRLVYVNAGFERNTGYAREEVLGRTPAFSVSSGPNAMDYERIRSLVGALGSWSGEIVRRRKDGAEYREAVTISLIREPDGRVSGSSPRPPGWRRSGSWRAASPTTSTTC